MRCGYFDCFSGAAGNMILGAIVDAGCPVESFHDLVVQLGLPGVSLTAEKVNRHGLAGTLVTAAIQSRSQKKQRHLPDILKIIDHAGLSPRVSQQAAAIFRRLADAEATAHGVPVEQVHFHEVGAADAIVDIVGACAGIEQLGLERITCSPIPTGSGTLTCEHGVMPIPAPATAHLLKGVPLAGCDEPGELTTPTGAAILTTLADEFGPLPPMRIRAIGMGAGTRMGQTRPNLLRLIVGDAEESCALERDVVTILEAQVDDATGQSLGYACQRLLEAGALDAYITPIMMKKGRPGQLLTVVCRASDSAALEGLLFAETTTFGVRRHECARSKLSREQVCVSTRYGPIRVKVGRRDGKTLRAWPEYEDCASAARKAGVPLGEVQNEALRAWKQHDDA